MIVKVLVIGTEAETVIVIKLTGRKQSESKNDGTSELLIERRASDCRAISFIQIRLELNGSLTLSLSLSLSLRSGRESGLHGRWFKVNRSKASDRVRVVSKQLL
jgi:hypothetical protein